MKNKKILSLLISCAVIPYLTGCSNSENTKQNVSEKFEDYYTVTGNVALSYDLAYIDDIRSANGNVYVCGYSYITNQNYVFSLFDSVSGNLNEINIQNSETGDVTAVYLSNDKFYAGYRNGKSTWFCIYDAKTGNEIKKIPVEDNVRIASFFEDSEGSIIIDIRDAFGYGYIDKCSSDYLLMNKINIYNQISSQNMKISNMIYYDGCYYVVAEENKVSEQRINIFRVSEDSTLNRSYLDVVPESDEIYLTSYINSNSNLFIVSQDKSDRSQVTINEIQLSDGRIINSYYDELSIDSIIQTDMISDYSDFIYADSENVISYKTEEQKKIELDTGNGTLLYTSDRENKMLLCSNVYENSENPIIYQYDTEGKLIDEFHSDYLNKTGTAVKSDVLSGGNVCTLYKDSTDKYYVVWSDFKGIALNETSVFDGNNYTRLSIWAGADDKLYCTGYDEENDTYSLEVYNSSAQKIRAFSEIDSVKTIKGVFSINGNDCMLYTNNSDETRIRPADAEKPGESDKFSYPELDIEKIITCSDGSLCCFDADNAYEIVENDFAGKKIISWSNSGITYKAEAMCIPDDDTIVCFTSGNGATLTILERADEQMKEKLKNQKVITVGGVSISSVNFTEAVEKFNNEHPEYKICINDYLKYDGKNPRECISKLNLDIVSGKIPDIFIGSDSFDLNFYSEKGMFCDLNDFIDSDDEIQRTDFLENIFDCYKTQGKQSCVPVNFSVYALIGKKAILGSENGWTDDDFYRIASDKNMFYDSTVSSLCESLLYSNLSNYIDWKAGKCNFTDERFKKIAEYIYNNSVPDDQYVSYLDYPVESEEYGNYYRRFSDNLCYTEFSIISSLADLASLQNGTLNNEKIVLKGIPSVSASGPLVYARNTAGISSSSENKEGAWMFVKTLFSDEYQEKISSISSFPVRLSVFNGLIDNSYRNGCGYRTDGSSYETSPLSDDDILEFEDVVKNINHTYNCDSRIREIMREILDEYFSGRIKVNEAAEQIQNKVSLYLDEIR